MAEMNDCPFHAIVWTSARTEILTPAQLAEIKETIYESIPFLRRVVGILGSDEHSDIKDIIKELYEQLSALRILLVLDNLETVVDQHISDLLANLPDSGSRVLITSRITVGAYEAPVHLLPLELHDAVEMLRQLAYKRGILTLTETPTDDLANYFKAMGCNPGYIRWFVDAVQARMRPEDALHREGDVFVEFCMRNVYEWLPAERRQILGSMLVVTGQFNQAELAYYNQMNAEEFEPAMRQLGRTAFILKNTSKDTAFESKYELTDLAMAYLSRYHPVPREQADEFTRRKREMRSAFERLDQTRRTDPYSEQCIDLRARSDAVIATNLLEALQCRYHHRERLLKKMYSGKKAVRKR